LKTSSKPKEKTDGKQQKAKAIKIENRPKAKFREKK